MQRFNKSQDGKPDVMYRDKFLLSLRHSSSDDSTYITGRVAAEMRKNLVYKVDVKLDNYGVVQETQCECSVGMGPNAHCKHVGLVLFALTKQKEGILTKQTCTQVLQTHHQSKKYDGSPIQMSHIKLRKSEGLHQLHHFDPRPAEYRNTPEFNTHFRNVWMNATAKDLPIRQLFEPANILAVCHDHDYMEFTHEEYFLKSLNISSITESDLKQVERATRGQNNNKQWKEERRKRIHASNFGRICKSGDRTDFAKMARSLTDISEFSSKPTDHGLKYESVAVTAYCSKTGNVVQTCGIHVCPDIPYLACSPDGLVDSDGIVEVKCPYTCKNSEINATSVPYLFIDSSGKTALKPSHNYYFQVQGTLLCTKRKWCDFVVWTMKDMKIMRIPRNEECIKELTVRLQDFFEQYFKPALLETFLYRGTFKYDFS